uniref:Uncharacterized protein n=1 Tax=viral metagenome TaxID=1070528 RepID=A0A6M3L922_9ZZZZ
MDNENKVLDVIKLKNIISDIIIGDEGISFDDIKIEHAHSQDCCENVYADWSHVEMYKKDLEEKGFENLVIKLVEGEGLLLCFLNKWDDGVKIFIPCYNYQNGYYSDNLDLLITKGEITKAINIQDAIEHHID